MIKIFGGTDTFESYQGAKKYAEKKAKELSLELEIINIDDLSSPTDLMEKIEGIGMFSVSKFILGKRLFKNKKILDYVATNYDKLKNYELAFWEDSKPDGKLKLTKSVKKDKCLEVYELPKPWELEKWVQKVCQAKRIPLSKTQISFLVERSPEDKWIIVNQLQKIFLYLDGAKTISDEELSAIIGLDSRGDIWKFVEKLMSKDIKGCIEEFNKINRYEDNVFYVLAMIQREVNLLRDVLIQKNSDADYKSLGIHPFVLQKTMKYSDKYSLQDLYIMQLDLIKIETEVKSGKLPERIALTQFLVNKT